MSPPRNRHAVAGPAPAGHVPAGSGNRRLTYTSDAMPGIRRRRTGSGFVYVGADGRRLRGAATLERIRKLAIPPAYRDVWICRDPAGHLQATGRDARGRKQYRYHPAWRERQDRDKFARMVEFGERLPVLRRQMRSDLRTTGLARAKIIALAISLLDTTMMRVGNREYLRSNGSHGLTTLRDRHAAFARDGIARLHFRGKGGRMHDLRIDDGRLVRLLRRCQHLPGQFLFQYVDDAGTHQPIDSGMINDYLRATMGADFTAKDFRTWGASRLALAVLAAAPPGPDERATAAGAAAAVAQVAKALGNTPAVCRASYIHPAVLEAWREGRLPRGAADVARPTRRTETALLSVLRKRSHGMAASGRRRARSQ